MDCEGRSKLHQMYASIRELEYQLTYIKDKVENKPCSQKDEEQVQEIQWALWDLEVELDKMLSAAQAGVRAKLHFLTSSCCDSVTALHN